MRTYKFGAISPWKQQISAIGIVYQTGLFLTHLDHSWRHWVKKFVLYYLANYSIRWQIYWRRNTSASKLSLLKLNTSPRRDDRRYNTVTKRVLFVERTICSSFIIIIITHCHFLSHGGAMVVKSTSKHSPHCGHTGTAEWACHERWPFLS